MALGRNMDFLAGLLMLVIGGGACTWHWISHSVAHGAWDPVISREFCRGILMGFGVLVLIRGPTYRIDQRSMGLQAAGIHRRIVVRLRLDHGALGLFPRAPGAIPHRCRANHTYKIGEVLILCVAMSIFAWVVFIWLLGLPYPLIGAHEMDLLNNLIMGFGVALSLQN